MIHRELYLNHGGGFQSFHMSAFLDRASNLKSCHLANNHEVQVVRSDRHELALIQLSDASAFRGQ